MGKVFPELDESLRAWIGAQKMFFVATAPRGGDGHVNCSPKGLNSFRILGPTTVAYLDYIGSGVETIAHVRQNQRILITFCAFEGAPKIGRLAGDKDPDTLRTLVQRLLEHIAVGFFTREDIENRCGG